MELLDADLRIPASLAIAAAAVLLVLRALLGEKRRTGPRHPRAGTVFHELIHLSKLHDYHADLASRHGCFRMSHFTRDYVYLVDPAAVEHILRTNFSNYVKGSYNYELTSDLFGDGIFAVDGEKWRQQRKLASFVFTARNLKDYSSGVFRRKAVALAQVISEAADSNRTVDIQDLLMKSTLDSIFKVGFGVDLDTLSGSNAEGSSFGKAFDASSEVIMRRFYDVFWKFKKLLNVGAEAELKENIRVIDEFVYDVIRKKTTEQMISAQQTVKEDILSRFLAQGGGEEMDVKYLRDIMLNLVIAGRDTTAGTLSWFLYMLCKHPGVQEKVAREVAAATGAESYCSSTFSIMTDFAAMLTEEALDKMQYLHAALAETLRLYPAVPVDLQAQRIGVRKHQELLGPPTFRVPLLPSPTNETVQTPGGEEYNYGKHQVNPLPGCGWSRTHHLPFWGGGGLPTHPHPLPSLSFNHCNIPVTCCVTGPAPAAQDPKGCLTDDTLPDGFDERAGDLVCYVPYSMGRMKRLWGEDAADFRPERWLDGKGDFRPESPFKFAAFQAGPRVCLGKDFAYRQMKILVAVLVHFFSFQLSDAGKEVTYRNAITLQIDKGLHVRACWRVLPRT